MDTIARLNASLTGRYTIERELGAGGMATVYLAHDVKHDRHVALKVLKPELAAVLGGERFVVEIKTTAALQHPHILPLFDSGTADTFLFYVMPFIDGETLRTKLDRETQLGVDEAVRIAREVADALEYAHQHGIVHRDIKPENILLHGGHAMVADFGIALAVSAAAGGRMTETGLSLGTPHYMSPEQATAEKEITARSDVYSLGSVLYEMLTGNPPHTGASAQQIIMKIIIEAAAPVTQLRRTVPPNVAAALAKSLEKLPADRFESAKAFGDALTNPAFAETVETYTARGDAKWRRHAIITSVAATVLFATTLAAWWRPTPPQRVERFELPIAITEKVLQAGGGSGGFSLSRDGSRIVYSARSASGADQLWVRDLASLNPRPIPGTEGGVQPAISPDGESVVFVTRGSLKTISIRGDNPATLVPSGAAGPSWAGDGMIYFAEQPFSGHIRGMLHRVPASGGRIDTLVTVPGRAFTHVSLLPGGHGLLAATRTAVIAIALPDGAMHELVNGSQAEYSNTGHLIYVTRDGVLMGAPFDPKRLAVTGPAVALSETGPAAPTVNWLSLSSTGAMLYGIGSNRDSELAWVTREGVALRVDTATHGDVGFPALSPDGTRVAFRWDGSLWVRDLARGTSFKLTNDAGNYVAWTSDGRSVSYFTQDSLTFSLWTKRADGSSQATPLLHDLPNIVESFWTPDGKSLIVRTAANSAGAGDIYMVRASADTAPTPILDSKFTEAEPALSSDGKWLAFASNESGRYEVYVVPFPNVGTARWNVSTRGGTEPAWSHRGSELFYRDGAGNLISIDVKTTPSFSFGASKALFSASMYAAYDGHQQYAVSPDDKRFLMVRPFGMVQPPKLVLVKNWVAEFKAKSEAK